MSILIIYLERLKTNKCSICKRKDAVYHQKHSGLYLCKSDFIKNIERRVRRTINKHNLLKETDRIAIGVSGGKDSLTLLNILYKIEKKFKKSKLIAVMIDEGIKGYREEAIELAIKMTEKLGVPLEIFSFKELYGYTLDEMVKIAKEETDQGPAPCSYCGTLRRRSLNYAAKKVNANKLATAHNLDDESQTVLMNVLRSDINRIGRAGPYTRNLKDVFVPKIKPMREILEKEIVLYAYYNDIPFHSVECPYAPISFRSDIRNFLNKMEYQRAGIKYALLRSGDKIRKLHTDSQPIYECIKCNEPSTSKICKVCKMFDEIGITIKRLKY
ncbi:MAG: TIGR00269 family protein [Candidatus Lokiarchaeota archaeon]|nr:TIGR00269 family protein [Candidatus Lokiarchaeota archaeon]